MTERPLGYEWHFGSGWISGVCAVALGALGAGAVLCIRYPALLTVPDARVLYPLEIVPVSHPSRARGCLRSRPAEHRAEPPRAAGARLFGTYYMPADRWPAAYGIEGAPVPRDYARQLVYPFTAR